jgi:hypothetical protein
MISHLTGGNLPHPFTTTDAYLAQDGIDWDGVGWDGGLPDEPLSRKDAQRDRLAKDLKAAKYWLNVSVGNDDGSALHAALIVERRNTVNRLAAELEQFDDAVEEAER